MQDARSLVAGSVALLLGALAAPSAAHADDAPSEKARAERLFLRGKELMEAGKTEAACVTFEESLRHDRAGGTLLNVAECYVALQRYASAEASLREARGLAEAAQRSDAVKFVDERLADIEPKVAHLRLTLPDDPPRGLAVTVDGAAVVTDAAQPIDLSVDPGRHTIVATAPLAEAHPIEVAVEGDGARLTILLPKLVARVSPAEPTPSAPPQAQRIVGWSLASVGAASLAAGSALGIAALVSWNEVDEACPEVVCDDAGAIAKGERAGVFADGATLALGIGAASATLGLVLVLTAPSQRSRGTTVAIAPSSTGLTLKGWFQ